MVWYGMAWYGMVWYGMVWYGMVWYGMVWYGMVWYGMVLQAYVVCALFGYYFLSSIIVLKVKSGRGKKNPPKNDPLKKE